MSSPSRKPTSRLLLLAGLSLSTMVWGCGSRRDPQASTGSLSGPDAHGSSPNDYEQADQGIPPISGGTLLVTKDRARAYASDPDRDRVVVVDLAASRVVAAVALAAHAEPGRATEDAAGRVHVVLRGSGELLTLDGTGNTLAKRPVCSGPRGAAYDAGTDEVVVACLDGTLTRMMASPEGEITTSVNLGEDLRDVVFSEGRLFVSRFRSAEVLVLGPHDRVKREVSPPTIAGMAPTVAWRMTPWPGVGVYVAHQRATSAEIDVSPSAPPNAYVSGGHTAVEISGTTIDEHGDVVESGSTRGAALDVDASVDDEGEQIATVAASSDVVFTQRAADGAVDRAFVVPGEPIAVRWVGSAILVQTREPSSLVTIDEDGEQKELALGGDVKRDFGHTAFHRSAVGPTNFACASCHPEGRDDGHTWNFESLGPRRTQSLIGGIGRQHSFHWDAELASFDDLVSEVYERRMGNAPLTSSQDEAFETWLDGLPDLPTSDEPPPAEGRAAFEKAGCAACHSGERLTNDAKADVGTGGRFKTPSLIGLKYRGPFLHDGCAATIADRFTPCGGDRHGDVTVLDDEELDALIGYLEAL